MSEPTTVRRSVLTEAAWPVFEFVTNFVRSVKQGTVPPPEQVRYLGITALRDAEDLACEDPTSERAWHDRVKAMLVYFIDYKMLNTEWHGKDFWFDSRFETDPEVLNHVESLGGDKFFEDCDELQKEYELSERRDRKDKEELAEQLSLYFVCLRLGFRGRYHDRPQELADYTRRLWSRLPAYANTRGRELFPEAYKHTDERKVDYRLGLSAAVAAAILGVIVAAAVFSFWTAWNAAAGPIREKARLVEQRKYWEATGASEEAHGRTESSESGSR